MVAIGARMSTGARGHSTEAAVLLDANAPNLNLAEFMLWIRIETFEDAHYKGLGGHLPIRHAWKTGAVWAGAALD
jgi:hypothetical protein